jgi:hypothetical protein
MQFCGIRSYPRQTPEGCRRWTKQPRSQSRQPARRDPENEPERRSEGVSLGARRAGPGDSDCWSWRESAAATGGGLRVNNRMQATAGSLVVTASAVRRRA